MTGTPAHMDGFYWPDGSFCQFVYPPSRAWSALSDAFALIGAAIEWRTRTTMALGDSGCVEVYVEANGRVPGEFASVDGKTRGMYP